MNGAVAAKIARRALILSHAGGFGKIIGPIAPLGI